MISKIETWDYASRLKYTNYDVTEGGSGADDEDNDSFHVEPDAPKETFVPTEGRVATNGGALNLRKKPVTGTIMKRIPFDTILQLTEEQDGWYKTIYDGIRGWVSGDYIELIKPEFDRTIIADLHDEDSYLKVVSYLDLLGIEYSIMGGDD